MVAKERCGGKEKSGGLSRPESCQLTHVKQVKPHYVALTLSWLVRVF